MIEQYHPAFYVPYSGNNSLQPINESQHSITSTFFIGTRLWKNSSLYFNPELAGGSGFSSTKGVAGFPNGETFRIGSPSPAIYLARLYFTQNIPLTKEYQIAEDDINQIKEKHYKKQLSIILGKYCAADFFDKNQYSHDPRTQFMNWALMSAGAWDYPANTRGYTWGGLIQYTSPRFEFRLGCNTVPTYANGPVLNFNLNKANATTMELQFNYSIRHQEGNIKLLSFYNNAPMGSYQIAVSSTDSADITLSRSNGRSKYGLSLNMEQHLNSWIGLFSRTSWNDGKNETWAFTEIDESTQIGLQLDGCEWKRNNDCFGIAEVIDGISKEHRNYLKKGGNGFMLGDGKLNYSPEYISEMYYSFNFKKYNTSISPDYQLIINPGYNKARKGPVNVFSVRVHVLI